LVSSRGEVNESGIPVSEVTIWLPISVLSQVTVTFRSTTSTWGLTLALPIRIVVFGEYIGVGAGVVDDEGFVQPATSTMAAHRKKTPMISMRGPDRTCIFYHLVNIIKKITGSYHTLNHGPLPEKVPALRLFKKCTADARG
jgi:hypothetical protein